MKISAVFLDRDDTIIQDSGFMKDPEEVVLLPGAVEGLKKLQGSGFDLIIISNQSGIGRGLLTLEELFQVNARLLAVLKEEGIGLKGVYWCPHTPEDNCQCRKPGTLLIERAKEDFNIDLGSSAFIGDRASDIGAGKKAGLFSIKICGGSQTKEDPQADAVVENLNEAADLILKHFRKDPISNG